MRSTVLTLLVGGALVACSPSSDGDTETDAPVETGVTDDGSGGDTASDAAIDDGSGNDDAVDGGSGDEGSGDDATPDEDPAEQPPDPLTASWCYRDSLDPELPGPNYDQFNPIIGSHCLGTNMQDIQGVQKVVFFGDSVTVGTPPTRVPDYYRSLVEVGLKERFGNDLVVESFARFGARVDDLLLPDDEQFRRAFPAVEPLTTLVVFTIGGNDIFRWAENAAEGRTPEEIEGDVDRAIALLTEALDYLAEPGRFPNGVYVIFANVFEFTDGTGDTASCDIAAQIGLGEPWPEGRAPVVRFNEAYMRLAVDHGFDLVFMLEHFCGHGFRYQDETSQCYRGPEAEQWFDFTCIHPNPTGHRVLADMVLAVVDE